MRNFIKITSIVLLGLLISSFNSPIKNSVIKEKYLLIVSEKGNSIKSVNNDSIRKINSLMIACRDKKFNRVKELIDSGVNVNGSVPNSSFYVALNSAIENPNMEIIDLLLKNGANPNIQQLYSGLSPFAEAAGISELYILKKLYDYGGIINPDTLLNGEHSSGTSASR